MEAKMEESRTELLGKLASCLAGVYEYCYHGALQPQQVITKIAQLLDITRNGVCLNQFEGTPFAHADLAGAAMHIISVASDSDYISSERLRFTIDFLENARKSFPHCIYYLSSEQPNLNEQVITRQEELDSLFAVA